MASRFFINGLVNSNWSSITNWSTTSGGVGGSSVPTNADDVTLDTNSPNCIIDSTSNCKIFTTTNYSHTITFNSTLTTIGNITLGSNMIFDGTYSLIVASSSTFTSNNKHLNIPITFYNALTGNSDLNITLADTLYANSEFNVQQGYPTSSQIVNIIGATAIISSNFTDRTSDVGGLGGLSLDGTSPFIFNGNTIIYSPLGGFSIYNPIVISCSSFTYDPVVSTIQFHSDYTYIAGTITYNNMGNMYFFGDATINSTPSFPFIVNLSSGGTYTFNSTFSCDTIYISGSPDITLAGGYGFNVDSLVMYDPIHLHLAQNIEYKVNTFFQVQGYYTETLITATGGNTIDSTTPGSQAFLTLASTASTDITYLTVTDINSSRGQKLYIYNGSLSNTNNWGAISITRSSVSKTFVN